MMEELSPLKFNINTTISIPERKARVFGVGFVDPNTRFKKLEIGDIPIMITNENEVLCIPRTDEVKHIGVTGMCYDKETEVLTDKGWKLFSELDKTELIAQVDTKTFEIEFVKPLSYTKERFFGEMIHFNSKVLDLMVTPTHNMFVKHRKKHCTTFKNFQFLPAHRLLKGEWVIKQACSKNKNPIKEILFSPKLLGIWMAEGCINGVNNIEISQNEGEKLERIKQMLKENNLLFRQINRKGKEEQTRLFIKYSEFANYAKQFGKAKNKFIPDWIKNNSSEIIRDFLDWFFLGDGDLHKGRKRYSTASKKLADDIQECLLRIGTTSKLCKYENSFAKQRGKIEYLYSIEERDTNYAVLWQKSNKQTIFYDDYVYCVTVPTHLLVVRRKGRIAICANTGTLKTLFLNSLLSWDYWHMGNICINLNDYQRDSFEWSLPSISYKAQLERLHINPCPTPIVYVFPSTKTLQINEKDKRFPIIKMTIPIAEAIRNVKNYWSLDKSEKYLVNIMDDLVECTSIGEIKSIIDENFPYKHQSGMRFKLLNIFQTFFNNNMLNVSVPEAPAFLDYEDRKGNNYHGLVISALMRAGFVPSIQTSDLRNQEYFSAYMTFIVSSIYDNQFHDEYFKDKNISLFADEIDKMWMGNNGHLVKSALNLMGTNGRMARIGLRWSTQHYEKVPDQIRGNTKYLFISRKADAKEVKEINKDFDIPKSMRDDILRLVTDAKKGIFEMVAVTTERFVLYDLDTGERSYTSPNSAKRGFLIPPMACHRVPGVNI